MPRAIDKSWKQAGWQFWLLTAFLCLIFFTGGSSRADVQSLAILRPAAVFVFGIALAGLKREDLARYRTLVIFAAIIVALVALYLVPLPPSFLGMFPAGDAISETNHAIAFGGGAYPAALVPVQAWNSFYSLFVPLAVFTLGIQLDRNDVFRLLPVMLVLGLFSGLIGLVQILGSAEGPLYFYKQTSNGSAVGFFANRNHQAVMIALLFPMLAIFVSSGIKSVEQATIREWMTVAIGIFLVPLILVTGSRAGLVIGLIALLAALTIYRKPEDLTAAKRKRRTIDWRIPLVGLGVVFLGLISLVLSRAQAIDRLISEENGESRSEFWMPIADMARNNMPLGTGPGSIVESYAQVEPIKLLDSSYLNRAHNDWLEVFANFGVPGIMLLVAIIGAVLLRSTAIIRQNPGSRATLFSKMGLAIVVLAALASIVDYPVRTPTMSAIIVIAMIWLTLVPRDDSRSSSAAISYRLENTES